MTPTWRRRLRAVVQIGGLAVEIAGVFAFRIEDWPIYLVFFFLAGALHVPAVQVLPRLRLPVAQLATQVGFLYIAGLPILPLTTASRLFAGWLVTMLPGLRNAPPRSDAPAIQGFRALLAGAWTAGSRPNVDVAADQGTGPLGNAARWLIVSVMVGHGPPISDFAAIALAEVGGYLCWGLLSALPIYPDRTLVPRSLILSSYRLFGVETEGGARTAVADVGAIVILAVTPFVFLIVYGFHTHGLAGATLWSAATLGLHFVLNRLHARRLTVEEQNRRLETLNRELEQRERLSAIGKMSSVISHQILHELGVIGIYADLVLNADRDGDAAAALAQSRRHGLAIEGALRNVNRVLTDLLVFSKDLRLNLYDHSLRRIVEECVDECRAEAVQRGLVLQADCLDDVTVTVDKLKLKQAVSNVLRNAIEASPAGKAVSVEARVKDGTLEVRVADEGPGVPERDRETVFTPFFTTKEHGTGLGLAIAREFAEAHRGRLTVERSAGGQGATFVFRLPQGSSRSEIRG